MSTPSKAELARQIAKLERAYGITPKPTATLEQRAAAVAARQGSKPAPKRTRAGRSDLSGDGERMDRAMGLPDPTAPIVEQRGNVVVMRAIRRDDARKHLAEYRTRYGIGES